MPNDGADPSATNPGADRSAGLPEAYPSQPIRYIDRTRRWYELLGYEPYRWPHYDEVPFTPLTKPLAGSRLALVTTAAPVRPDAGDQGPGAAYNGAAKFFDVYTSKPPIIGVSGLLPHLPRIPDPDRGRECLAGGLCRAGVYITVLKMNIS